MATKKSRKKVASQSAADTHPSAYTPLDQSPGHNLAPPGLLNRLGLLGLESIEPVVLASLVTTDPLLLIGVHGSAKSLLLESLAQALGLSWRHYNASLLNFDDLVGYPLPDDSGQLHFVKTPASVWGAQAVFIDEISLARIDIQNRLFPIIHEKRVQGLPLPNLRFRWAAMNPPALRDDESDFGEYAGSEPLDLALTVRAFALGPDGNGSGDAQRPPSRHPGAKHRGRTRSAAGWTDLNHPDARVPQSQSP